MYVVRRAVQAVITLLGVSLISFSLLYIFPGDPAEFILSIRYGYEPSAEDVARLREELGLNRPLVTQYLDWLSRALRGDFGMSWTEPKAVMPLILERAQASAELFLATFLISIFFAFVLGILSSIYRDRWIDHLTRMFSMLGISIPSFWLGLVLIWIFSVNFHLLPAFGCCGIKHLVLPVLTWSFSFMAIKTRFIRASVIEELSKEYIVTARSKGLAESAVVLRHALRNALIPIVTYLSMSVSHLIVGSIMVEVVFSWEGLGTLLVKSVFERDFPVVQALVFLSGVVMISVNLVVDLLYTVIDPRVKYGE
ncbi:MULTISPECIES: ABC transporter permease [unclassified Archaeoglobus]|jgi:peptide/nickel transport system permease protein|uniref:ABC transporter permease n=1 Tax=unclassified Archaeoglobus TaxID=2643606 RepID=UPI0025BED28E|nr:MULTISPECIES: ABC transporter permease [unclassified Archaeoglobus]